MCFTCVKGWSQAFTTIPSLFQHPYLTVPPDMDSDKNGNYWLTGMDGILRYNSSGVTYFPDLLYYGSGNCITVDTNNIAWMGTAYDGVIKFNGTNFYQFDTLNSTIGNNCIKQIFADRNNNIWVYDNSNTLSMYNGSSWTSFSSSVTGINWQSYGYMPIDCDNANNIYFGTPDTGIVKFDGTTWSSINTSNSNIAYNNVRDLHVAPDNSLWILTYQNISMGTFMIGKYDGSAFSYYAPPLSIGLINSGQFSIDQYNNIWTSGTAPAFNTGLFKFDQSSWQHYKDPYGMTGLGIFMFMSPDGSIWTYDFQLISVFNENGFSNISGNVYNDLNGNGIKDNGESGLPCFKVEIPGYGFSLTDAQGNYHLLFDDSALTYSVQLTPVNYWTQTSLPASYSVTPLTDPLTGYDFGIQQTTNINDLVVSVSNFPLRPGWNVPFWINVQNSGSNSMNDTVSFTYDASLTLIATSVPPDYSNGNTLKWYSTSGPGSLNTLQVVLQVSTSAIIGDTLYFSATADPSSGDAIPADNIYNYYYVITGAFDPNCKIVFPEEYIAPDQWLNYTICFQNTGTDTAFNVIIYDTLDANLDVSSFELTGSGHPVSYTLNGPGNIAFKFLNIQLPDSNTNEPASHGFVSYRIKPQPSLVNGTQLFNTAGIAFDFNSIVVTNETANTIDNTLGMPEEEMYTEELKVYPNPAHDFFVIVVNVPVKENYEFTIYDVDGRQLGSQENILSEGENSIQINSANFQKGLYIVAVKSEFAISYSSIVID